MAITCTATLVATAVTLAKDRCLIFSKFSPQVFILLLTIMQLLMLWVHYFFTRHLIVLAFAQRCLYVLEFSCVFFFFTVLVCRVMRRRYLIRRVVAPVAGATVVAVILLFVVGSIKGAELECGNHLWKILTLFSVVIAISLIFVGVFVTRGINHVEWLEFRMKKSRRLWLLIVINCLSTLAAFIWDVGLLVNSPHFGCNFIMGDSIIENVLWVIDRVVANILPLWSVLYVMTTLPNARTTWNNNYAPNPTASLLLSHPSQSRMSDDDESEIDLLGNWKREELWRDLNITSVEKNMLDGIGSVHQVPSFSPPYN